MKRLFFWLLNHYSQTESQRIEILKILDEKVCNDYSEQTTYGNVYNFYIEFIMANKFVIQLVKENDKKALTIVKRGISNSFDESVGYIKNEIIKKV